MTASEAARLACVSRQRIDQWCFAAGFDAAEARKHYLTTFYARQLLLMGKRDRIKAAIAPSMRAKVPRRAPRKSVDKAAERVELDAKIISFTKRGGEIKKLPMRKPRR